MQNHKTIFFPTEYQLILERINAIDPVKYASTRNYINGHVTYLAPYISRGVVSVKQILDVVLDKGFPIQVCEKLMQELTWREYYQRVWQAKNNLIWEDLKHPQSDVVHEKMIAAVQNAQTGISILDKSINDFYKHGYLHNHIRMYLAAITCNIGKAHWLQPAKWMYYHLLDGDIASNNCSWQWVSGAFSSKKYYCNQENINKYTYSQQTGTFLDQSYESIVNMPIPQSLQQTIEFSLTTNLPKTPLPNINTSLPTLIYNAYNLDPNWRKDENVNRVLLLEPDHFNKYPVSNKVIEFIIDLSKSIHGIQLFVGEVSEIEDIYALVGKRQEENIISKEHPAFNYYPGLKDDREWMFPAVTGYHNSFFSYWKKCQRELENLR